jgi:hypothetical protein
MLQGLQFTVPGAQLRQHYLKLAEECRNKAKASEEHAIAVEQYMAVIDESLKRISAITGEECPRSLSRNTVDKAVKVAANFYKLSNAYKFFGEATRVDEEYTFEPEELERICFFDDIKNFTTEPPKEPEGKAEPEDDEDDDTDLAVEEAYKQQQATGQVMQAGMAQ